MQPTQEIVDDIYLEKILRARAEPLAEKILDGPRLFAFACEASRAGIRLQHPHAAPEEINRLLRERFTRIALLRETANG